jgi:hypothetical protein
MSAASLWSLFLMVVSVPGVSPWGEEEARDTRAAFSAGGVPPLSSS